MKNELELVTEPADQSSRLLTLALVSLIAGLVSGILGAIFRLTLERADGFRNSMLVWAHSQHIAGFLLVLGVSAFATGLSAWLVRRFSPQATGSGIPHVEAQVRGRWSGNPLHIIPVKFVGGALAIGAGLALGREGPTVQIGASISHLIGKAFRRNQDECKALLAAGAGAGLATAFNAPIAGAVFVLEELVGRFDLPIMITTLAASAGAIAAARAFLGQAPDFHVEALPYPGFATLLIHLVLGLIIGLIGVAYNRAIVGALAVTAKPGRYSVEVRAALIGAVVGLLAWFAPHLVGGGDVITQQMVGGTAAVSFFGLAFVLRFGLGAVSYAARTPGGLFAPMLVLGAQSGLLFGTICHHWFPALAAHPTEFAVVGIAAFFCAVVRAPLTGVILAVELTGSFTLFLPMMAACFAATLLPTLLRNPPIYDSLRDTSSPQSEMPASMTRAT